MMKSKITQIIPCSRLYAVFSDQGKDFTEVVTCLALVEDNDGYQHVEGMVAGDSGIYQAGSNTNFKGYLDTPIREAQPTDIVERLPVPIKPTSSL